MIAKTAIVQNLELHTLRPHERVKKRHVKKLAVDMAKTQLIMKPIVVDQASLVILDGHHRFYAAQQLGLVRIPCLLVTYEDDVVALAFWKKRYRGLTKDDVIKTARAGRNYPHKTTRHSIRRAYDYTPVHLLELT